ncbi:MAG: hypothetical protein HOI95_13870 [Chromatiales bacterium]|nr:hypothetical protein [Chromatiales bacterium]
MTVRSSSLSLFAGLTLWMAALCSAQSAGEIAITHDPDASRAAARTQLLLVTGLAAEPFYAGHFERWSANLVEVAKDGLQVASSDLVWLAPPGTKGAAGEARLSSIEASIARMAAAAHPEGVFMMVLIGHGTARGQDVLFNLAGPDVSAQVLAELLRSFGDSHVIVVNTAAASGPFIPLLSAPGRTVITATSHARENEFTRFGEYFSQAFTQPSADTDKDARISLFEAFEYTRKAVARSYAEQKLMQTEHALLDDNGDGRGTPSPSAGGFDGAVARSIYLDTQHASLSKAGLALRVDARALVGRIESLKRGKHRLRVNEYYDELESLLLALAVNRRALREVVDQ